VEARKAKKVTSTWTHQVKFAWDLPKENLIKVGLGPPQIPPFN
jgi:hypothetical protein